jgi:NitT/TauT family transport system permease protein/sulfonate transport system permease protein
MNLALDCAASLTRVLIGVVAAAALGILFGLLRSALPERIKRNKLVSFLIEAPKFPPPIAWIPFVILWFGIGEFSAYVIVFIGAFAPIFIATYDGAESAPRVFRQTAASLEIRGTSYLRRIIFMNALPNIFSGLRAGVSMGWMSVIAAEMISGQSGLGYSIQLHRLNLQYELMVVDMVMIGVLGFLLFEMIVIAEKFAIPWNEKGEKL